MVDPEVPPELVDAQRRFNAAHAAVVAAAKAGEPIAELWAEERIAAVELHRLRAGTPWAAWDQQQRVREAAAGDGGPGPRGGDSPGPGGHSCGRTSSATSQLVLRPAVFLRAGSAALARASVSKSARP
jgi:hypothetical protein